MELLEGTIAFFLQLDVHLVELLRQYGAWIYAILFVIVFSETGLVVTPFLPGDSLLFAVGALAAIDPTGTLSLPLLAATLISAAFLGNTSNYAIGRFVGPSAFSGRHRLLKVEHLRRTEAFFARHGGKAVVLSRFLPVLRTLVPFVAGISRMHVPRFLAFNALGATSWTVLFLGAGYLFGNIPLVRENFGLMTLGLFVVLGVLGLLVALLRPRTRTLP